MKKKTFWAFLTGICSLIFCGCWDITTDHQLSLTNKTGREISFLYSNNAKSNSPDNNVAFYASNENVIKPDSTKDIIILGNGDAWHNYIDAGSSKKLSLYIFETDTLYNYNGTTPISNLVNKNKYFKLLTYSEKELDKNNWHITVQ